VIATLGTFVLMSGFVITGALVGGGVPVAPARGEPLMPVAFLQDRRKPARTVSGTEQANVANTAPTIGAIARDLQREGEADRRIAVIGASEDSNSSSAAIALARILAR
jgi:hypothetical protein